MAENEVVEDEVKKECLLHEKIFKRVTSKSHKTVFRQKRIGDLVAIKVDDQVAFGYSLCNKIDRYNFVVDGEKFRHVPNLGFTRAKTRAIRWADHTTIKVPPSIQRKVEKFMTRCKKYFQDMEHQAIIPMEVEYPQYQKVSKEPLVPRHVKKVTGFRGSQFVDNVE